MFKRLLFLIILLLTFSCEKNQPISENDELFTVLFEKHTGISFENKLDENINLNGFVYEYYYNGAGVATADFNNDGLIDIYFVSNRRANNLYLNQGNLEFKNVTKSSNTKGKFGFPTGVTVVDINQDGLMDIYICKSGRIKEEQHLKNELLINTGINANGIPIFKESAQDYGLDLPYYSTQASFFDYDRDGDLDMFLINHGINVYSDDVIWELMLQKSPRGGERLFKNTNGKFVDVTETSGIINNKLGYALGISLGDVNNDGWPDVYVAHDYSEKDHLYLNNQDGTYDEVSLRSFGHVSNFSMGSDIADINNDGLLDIMSLDMMANDNYSQKTSMSGMSTKKFMNHVDLGLHHQYMYNALQINNGVGPKSQLPLFSDVAQMSGLSATDWSWSPLLIDMDNDGFKDVFVSNGIKRDFRNNDFRIYKNKKQDKAYALGQLDKEAYIKDLLEKMPSRKQKNIFMRNTKDLTFNSIDFWQPETCSNGAAYADFDNDGDLDIVVNNSDNKAFIYRNNTEGKNSFLKIKLEGTKENRNAIGARVTIKANGTSQIAEHYFSKGFQSAMANDLHFGLGGIDLVDTVTVRWPDGSVQHQHNVAANQNLKLVYGETEKYSSLNKQRKYLFEDVTDFLEITFQHQENEYDDFIKESLIPHKMSQMGPGLSVADVDNDGLEDFYIGGAMNQAGALFLQKKDGKFKNSRNVVFENDKNHEDTSALFFDADNDGDQDLYVVSGGNEEEPYADYYQDRLYENLANGKFRRSRYSIPQVRTSGAKVAAGDYDGDGDLDLFIGSRVKPMHYGNLTKSYILENKSSGGVVKFVDVTDNVAPELLNFTMVTDAIWEDIDNDSKLELIVASEWGGVSIFKNKNGVLVNSSDDRDAGKNIGWWYSLAVDDIDNDGNMDIVAGNLGLNYKYRASKKAPFYMYVSDFDKNDSEDIVLAYHQKDKVYPLRGRQCSSDQMPFIKEKFKTYAAFGKAEIQDVYGEELQESIQYAATNFASGIFAQNANGQFKFKPFKNAAQISSINNILIEDFDTDGHKDLLLFGNLYTSEVETPRNDASYGHLMKGDGRGNFEAIPAKESGLYVRGDVKDAGLIKVGHAEKSFPAVLVARNNMSLLLLKIN